MTQLLVDNCYRLRKTDKSWRRKTLDGIARLKTESLKTENWQS